ncbi:hypothetical protein G3R49_19300 [Shewanella sp. WXL01]|uniref:hypothetical protein n=1 Tax=Shewanella sp. WXL01 TaxID=2709721 RepID=UPI00143855DA|nr:hypothetical protein [Shewanella sp. WXL01]NKF52706.1 hypothetical protein [Shewanella sp. WXL01]
MSSNSHIPEGHIQGDWKWTQGEWVFIHKQERNAEEERAANIAAYLSKHMALSHATKLKIPDKEV